MNEGMHGDEAAPGWDAIDAALRALYPGVEPRHVGYVPPAAFSANLQGCSAYPAAGHWHTSCGTMTLDDHDRAPVETPCDTLRALASAYADRPGYNPGWSL